MPPGIFCNFMRICLKSIKSLGSDASPSTCIVEILLIHSEQYQPHNPRHRHKMTDDISCKKTVRLFPTPL